MRARAIATALVTCLVLVGLGRTDAAAQGTTDQASSGPLVPTPIDTRIVFSPDAKITRVDGRTATLAGGYVAELIEHSVLIGGGGYWLVAPRQDARLVYGGLVAGLRALGGDRVNLTALALAGAGEGTVYRTVSPSFAWPDFGPRPGDRDPFQFQRRVAVGDTFFVVEPQVVLRVAVTNTIAVNFGGGYRATTARAGLNAALRGATGSIGVSFDVK